LAFDDFDDIFFPSSNGELAIGEVASSPLGFREIAGIDFLKIYSSHRRNGMKAKPDTTTVAVDKQLNQLVKKSVEGSLASNEAWSNIVKAIQTDQMTASTSKKTKPALSLSE
jgi:hypothetical protein